VRVGQNSYGVPTPSEIRSWYGGICPRCGHELETPTINDIVVKPNDKEELLKVLEEAKKTMRIEFRRLEPLLQQLRLEVERRRATQPPQTLHLPTPTGRISATLEIEV